MLDDKLYYLVINTIV